MTCKINKWRKINKQIGQSLYLVLTSQQVQYSIFIKSPLRGSSDLIYKMEKRKKKEKKTNLQI